MLTQFSVLLGLLAAGTQLWGYGSYVRLVERPNTASWSIWTVGAVLDVTSYFAMTHDWVKNILPIVCAIACVSVFAYSLVKRRFKHLSIFDWVFLALDGLITLWWLTAKDATQANLLYQVSALASFGPILWGVLGNGDNEHPRPWLIWSAAYSLFFASVVLRHPRLAELAYPGVNLVCHAAMFVAVAYKKRSAR